MPAGIQAWVPTGSQEGIPSVQEGALNRISTRNRDFKQESHELKSLTGSQLEAVAVVFCRWQDQAVRVHCWVEYIARVHFLIFSIVGLQNLQTASALQVTRLDLILPGLGKARSGLSQF